ncbi:MAG: DUF2497 domain-containing protein [Novosphingobium sp.]|nr:DUF2497 domain-containing protein [Novosphingobium sp.]
MSGARPTPSVHVPSAPAPSAPAPSAYAPKPSAGPDSFARFAREAAARSRDFSSPPSPAQSSAPKPAASRSPAPDLSFRREQAAAAPSLPRGSQERHAAAGALPVNTNAAKPALREASVFGEPRSEPARVETTRPQARPEPRDTAREARPQTQRPETQRFEPQRPEAQRAAAPQAPRPARPERSLSGDREVEAFRGPLASSGTQQSVRTSLDKLKTRVPDELEAKLEDLLRPMLREWLDEHLPKVVERLVRKEIERIARED